MEHDNDCENLRAYPGFPCDCGERKKLEPPTYPTDATDIYDDPIGEYPAL